MGVLKDDKEKDIDLNLKEDSQPVLTAEEFMKCTSFVIATSFTEKIDLFFEMIDTDGNGLLSWDEVHEISMQSLQLFNTGHNVDFLE